MTENSRSDQIDKQEEEISLRKTRSDKGTHRVEAYKCKLCPFESRHKSAHQVHWLNYHASTKERYHQFKYYCQICDFGNMTQKLFQAHLETKKHKHFAKLGGGDSSHP